MLLVIERAKIKGGGDPNFVVVAALNFADVRLSPLCVTNSIARVTFHSHLLFTFV